MKEISLLLYEIYFNFLRGVLIIYYLGGGSIPLSSIPAKGRYCAYPLLGVPGETLSVQLPPSGRAHPRTSLFMKKLSVFLL